MNKRIKICQLEIPTLVTTRMNLDSVMLSEDILKDMANSQAKESCDLLVVVFAGNAVFFLLFLNYLPNCTR